MKKYYFYLLCLLSFNAFAQRPKSVTDINPKGGSFATGIHIVQNNNTLIFNAYHPKEGNQLYAYDGQEVKRLSRFKDSYKNGRFDPEEQSKIPLGALSSNFIQSNNSILFSSSGELTKPSVYAFIEGQMRKVKSGLQTCRIYGKVNGDVYLIAQKKVKDETTQLHRWVKSVYVLQGGDRLRKISSLDNIAPRIRSMCAAKGKLYFCTSNKVFSFDGENKKLEQTFERELLSELVSIGDRVYAWSYRNRKKALFDVAKGQILTSRLVKNKNRMGFCPEPIYKNNKLVYCENGYFRTPDLVIANAEQFKTGNLPNGIFGGKYKVEHIESFTWYDDLLMICMKEKGAKEYALWQYDGDTLIKYRFRRLRDIRSIHYMNKKLYFIADGRSVGQEIYEFIPFKAPELRNYNFSMMENAGKGQIVGKVRVLKVNGKSAYFKIVGGNTNDAFRIDEFSGVIKVKNPSEINYRKNPSFKLQIEVDNRHRSSVCEVNIQLQQAKYLNRNNLVERFLFFPDFTRKGVLKTTVLKEGEKIEVYNNNLRMVDETVVQNGEILLGSYPPGIYYLNANNGMRNFVQKMEMN